MPKRPMKRYVVESTSSGVEVLVAHSDIPGDTTLLENLSGGFEWGYEGAGPRQLAYAILADLIAGSFTEAFMKEVVSKTSPIDEHKQVVVFYEKNILAWLKNKLNKWS